MTIIDMRMNRKRVETARNAQSFFEILCERTAAEQNVTNLDRVEIARLALAAKKMAEEGTGIRINAACDEDWNWKFT